MDAEEFTEEQKQYLQGFTAAENVPQLIERILPNYLDQRARSNAFTQFIRRSETDQLKQLFEQSREPSEAGV
jgi:hypothetical protein